MNKHIFSGQLVAIVPEAARLLAPTMASPPHVKHHSGYRIGELFIDSVITPWRNAEWRERLQSMADDDSIAEVFIHFDSPGGLTAGTPETAEFVHRVSLKKPTTAVVHGFCCSAAFWIASAARQIVATPTAMVGSLGVALILVDESEAFKSAGLRVVPIVSSPGKAFGTPGKKISQEEVNSAMVRIRQVEQMFVKDLRRFGRMTAQQREDAFLSGQVYHAEAGKGLGMIDKIAIPDDFISERREHYRRKYYLDLQAEEAVAQYEKLVCKKAGVSDFDDVMCPEDDYTEGKMNRALASVGREYPELAAAASK